jgi:hypothetical protein
MSTRLLQKAVQAYKSGHRGEARAMLLKYVEQDQRNELAWLLLSNLVPELEDRITALENALTLNPNNERAAIQLWKLKQKRYQDPLVLIEDHKQRLQDAIEARDKGQGLLAYNILRQLVEDDDRNEGVWLMLSELSPDTNSEITALENLLLLNPNHTLAKARLEQLQRFRRDPLALAQLYQDWGEAEKARDIYVRVAFESDSVIERREAERRIQNTEIREQVPNIRLVKPIVTLMRLITGSFFLYSVVTFIHGGLNLLQISPVFWLGGISVIIGSFLLVVASVPETHIIWQQIWKKLGREEAAQLKGLRMMGILLWFVPNFLIVLDSVLRFADTVYGVIP